MVAPLVDFPRPVGTCPNGARPVCREKGRTRALKAWGWRQVKNPDPTGPRLIWQKAREDALDPLSPHEARHCCASYLGAAGLTPKEAQTAMGHADIRTTLNIYAKAVPGWESGAVAKLDRYLEAPAKVAN